MFNQNERGSTARVISFVVLLGILPAWCFYIGRKYTQTTDVLRGNQAELQSYLSKSDL